jgi:hypothetical protein
MWKAFLIALVVAGAFATETNETSTGGTKDETAGGHYYGNSGYGYQPPPPPIGYNPYPQPAYTPPLVDDYVCDIDASILVVTNADRDDGYGGGYGNNGGGYGNNNGGAYGNNNGGGYGNNNGGGGYGGGHHHHHNKPNADRLKCSVIANFDEATCTSCCQIAARRDRSIPSKSIIGFIVDETQLDYDQNDNNYNNGPYRAKRGASETYGVGASPPATSSRPSAPYYPPRSAPVTPVVFASPANPLGPRGRCVCCAPRKFGVPHFSPPRYGY